MKNIIITLAVSLIIYTLIISAGILSVNRYNKADIESCYNCTELVLKTFLKKENNFKKIEEIENALYGKNVTNQEDIIDVRFISETNILVNTKKSKLIYDISTLKYGEFIYYELNKEFIYLVDDAKKEDRLKRVSKATNIDFKMEKNNAKEEGENVKEVYDSENIEAEINCSKEKILKISLKKK